jgi:hypothetical protein
MKEIVMQLVFDSWADTLPEIRSKANVERHLVYEGSGIMLDLVLKMAAAGSTLDIEGQVVPQDGATEFVCEIPVLLENGTVHARTCTNALGEFSLSTSLHHDHLDLAIAFGERRVVVRGLDSVQPRNWRVLAPVAAGGNQ